MTQLHLVLTPASKVFCIHPLPLAPGPALGLAHAISPIASKDAEHTHLASPHLILHTSIT